MTIESPSKRSDARANREKILEIAAQMLRANPQASLNGIAKAAEIGPGTLYRHFPTREALILAVYHQEIRALVELVPMLLAEHAPLVAFEHWCARLAEYGRIKSGIADVLHGVITDRDHQETYWPMVEALRTLLVACAGSGDFRSDADPEDVLLLLGFLWRIKSGDDAGEQADRLIGLVIHGLKVR